MSLEKVSVSFVAIETEDPEARRMDSEGSTAESQAVTRAIRKAKVNGGYVEDRSPEAIAMEGEGPSGLVEATLIRRASAAVKGLPVAWSIDRTMGAAVGRSVLGEAIPVAKFAANQAAEQNGPRIPGVNGNGKA